MAAVLFAPHADDESLFAAYICQDRRPLVIVVFDEHRMEEAWCATQALGCVMRQWGIQPGGSRATVEQYMRLMVGEFDEVFAPAVLSEGHDDHNVVGQAAQSVFGDVTGYLTYGPRGVRDTAGREIIPSPEWIAGKLAALACYRSQIQNQSTRPWFYELLDMREWLA